MKPQIYTTFVHLRIFWVHRASLTSLILTPYLAHVNRKPSFVKVSEDEIVVSRDVSRNFDVSIVARELCFVFVASVPLKSIRQSFVIY